MGFWDNLAPQYQAQPGGSLQNTPGSPEQQWLQQQGAGQGLWGGMMGTPNDPTALGNAMYQQSGAAPNPADTYLYDPAATAATAREQYLQQQAEGAMSDPFMAQQKGLLSQYEAGQQQDYAQQQANAQQLQQIAEGKGGPSAAALQMQAGTDNAIKAQQSIAAGARGGGSAYAAAARSAAEAGGALQQQNVQQTGILRAQEIAHARDQYTQALASMRAQELQAGQLAGGMGMQGQALAQQYALGMQGMSQQTAAEQLQAGLAMEQMRTQKYLQQQQLQNSTASGLMNMGGTLVGAGAGFLVGGPGGAAVGGYLGHEAMGGGASGGASGGAAPANSYQGGGSPVGSWGDMGTSPQSEQSWESLSDERAKESVHGGEGELDEFLSRLEPYSWEYKNPERDGDGRHYGVMAQDLERSRMGRGMVHETPRGKVVDTRKVAMGGLAALADHHERIAALERGRPEDGGMLSDEDSKKEIESLRSENKGLRTRMGVLDTLVGMTPIGQGARVVDAAHTLGGAVRVPPQAPLPQPGTAAPASGAQGMLPPGAPPPPPPVAAQPTPAQMMAAQVAADARKRAAMLPFFHPDMMAGVE
jgi:hypothetical protein